MTEQLRLLASSAVILVQGDIRTLPLYACHCRTSVEVSCQHVCHQSPVCKGITNSLIRQCMLK